PERRPPVSGVALEIELQPPVAEREEPIELALHHRRRDRGAGETERRLDLQLVLQHRPAALAREEPMRVAPMLQRSRDLLVAELAIRLVVEVAQPPTEVRGAEADLELDLAAVANPAFAVDDP